MAEISAVKEKKRVKYENLRSGRKMKIGWKFKNILKGLGKQPELRKHGVNTNMDSEGNYISLVALTHHFEYP